MAATTTQTQQIDAADFMDQRRRERRARWRLVGALAALPLIAVVMSACEPAPTESREGFQRIVAHVSGIT